MPQFARNYWYFYLEGRDSSRLPRHDVDTAALAKDLLSDTGRPYRDTLAAAAEIAVNQRWTQRKKRAWLDDHAQEIADAGGNGDEAYRAWLQGNIDELAYVMDRALIRALDTEVLEGDLR